MLMKQLFLFIVATILISNIFIFDAFAHSGRTAADGCHYCRTNCSSYGYVTGIRHCHGGGSSYTPPVTKTVAPVVAPVVPVQKTKAHEPDPVYKFEFPDCSTNEYYSSLSDQCECSLGYEEKYGKCVKEEVKEMDIEESYDYLGMPTIPEKPKTISEVEVPLESAQTSTNEDAAAGIVVGLGALAGAGYLFKKFRQ